MRRLAFALVLLLAGCGGAAPTTAPPPKPVAPPPPAPVPPCPQSIVPGGDPLEAEAFEGKPVVRVCVLGGSEESRKAAQKAIDARPVEIFSADRVRAELDAILRLGIFDDVSAHGLRVRDNTSVVLFYSVHDRPIIADVALEGSKSLGTGYGQKLPVEANVPFDPAKVNAVAQNIRDEYRSRGYDTCQVKLVTSPAAASATGGPPSVHVRIVVDEGPLWKLSTIDLRGNKRLREPELRKALGLKAGDPYLRDEVERATLLMTAYYFDRGFIQVHVTPELGAPTPGSQPITFRIEEGEVHTLSALHATKLGAPVEKELLEKVVHARPKQIFSRSALIEDIERVKAFFEKRGQRVEVTPLTEIDPKKNTIDITLQIEPASR